MCKHLGWSPCKIVQHGSEISGMSLASYTKMGSHVSLETALSTYFSGFLQISWERSFENVVNVDALILRRWGWFFFPLCYAVVGQMWIIFLCQNNPFLNLCLSKSATRAIRECRCERVISWREECYGRAPSAAGWAPLHRTAWCESCCRSSSDHTLVCDCSLVQKLKIMAERKIVSFLSPGCKFNLFSLV